MPLTPGTTLGPYQIEAAIGAGGMGEVYKARDTRLGRTVAIKVLPDLFAHDPERLARFEQEARTLASLNHAHIAQLYGIEEAGGLQALVMELVEGPTLAGRIAQGAIPLDEALRIAQQIAQALEAAHAQSIIHRDLNPANIKLRSDGTVKVLDFGLAKSFEGTPLPPDLTQSPTVLSPASTIPGAILGTAAYMSPEQARGEVVDKRTDIWAFGCVLFEMLMGHKPFDGKTLADTVAAIVNNEPDWRALPRGLPPAARFLLVRCLKKDRAQRLHDIADGRLLIEEGLSDPDTSAAHVSGARTYREWAGWGTAVLSLGVAVLLGLALLRAARPPAVSAGEPISFPVFPPYRTMFSGSINTTLNIPSFALSPDGRALVFSAEAPGAKPTLWLRVMNDVSPHLLAGTEGAQDPFWSPDSRWIAFYADGKLKKVPARGGAVLVITQVPNDFHGGTWGTDDTVLFSRGNEPILAVNAAGGTTTPVTTINDSNRAHRHPLFLPDGRRFIYTNVGAQGGVYAGSLDRKTTKLLVQVMASAVYAPSGDLLFVDGDTLLAQQFDAERLELTGQPFVVAEHVGRNTSSMSAVSASRTGALGYASTLSQNSRLTWFDRTGRPLGSAGMPEGDHPDFRLSPDQKRLAASRVNPTNNTIELWVTDLERGSTSRFEGIGGFITASALWSPDGSLVTFRTTGNGLSQIAQRSAAGGGTERVVLSSEAYASFDLQSFNVIPTDWSPDGQQVIFSVPGTASGNDLWLLPLSPRGKPTKFIESPAEQLHGNFSPNGRLVAYTSNESGRFEVYVETVPRSDQKWPVSTGGGYEPRWRADGRELYYLSEDRQLMAVTVGAQPSFGIPQSLFQTQVLSGVTGNRTHYVPSHDGQRFLVNVAPDAAASPITILLNWTATSKK